MTATDSFFTHFKPQPPDSLLKLIGEFRNDPRPGKIDLGVGVYRDTSGHTPVLDVVKRAERLLLERQSTKAYLGPEGNLGFATALKALVFGAAADDKTVCVQTPGGTGALRLAMDLVAETKTDAAVWLGTPTWPNHTALLAAAGLEIKTYRHFDPLSQTIPFDEIVTTLRMAKAGDIVLLHGCCHNPTGADFSLEQWRTLADLMVERKVLPLIDLAYQGLGDGFDADGQGVREVMQRCDEVLVAYSCDKNFALYRERVGALFVHARKAADAATVFSNMLACARTNWSMPPDHGAAIVQTVLDDADLRNGWHAERDAMRQRIVEMRTALSACDPFFSRQGGQRGMFSLLPIDAAAVSRLKIDHGVYMASSGRINVAGFTLENIPRFAAAIRQCVR
jgi:aromatic-amino-acid transaminase